MEEGKDRENRMKVKEGKGEEEEGEGEVKVEKGRFWEAEGMEVGGKGKGIQKGRERRTWGRRRRKGRRGKDREGEVLGRERNRGRKKGRRIQEGR